MHHDKHTETCDEKAGILGWDPRRVVKAVYFHRDDHVIGVVTPETGVKIDIKTLFPEVIPGLSRTKAKSYKNSYAPDGMTFGTCTPFPLESTIGYGIDLLVVMDFPDLDDLVVDISVGGDTEQAFHTSMHLQYKAIFDILHHKFRDYVVKY
jgi:prolyl-tRNA editing enzyme YbaK/EbsC (Cys-tRNA(Pro) deacylase)